MEKEKEKYWKRSYIISHAVPNGAEIVKNYHPQEKRWSTPLVKFEVDGSIYYLWWPDAVVVTNNFKYEKHSNTDIRTK